jgi:phospholipase/carboxylesterase
MACAGGLSCRLPDSTLAQLLERRTMKQQNTKAEFLPAEEIETRPNPSHSIIWMHGLGADGHDFVPVVSQLKLPPLGIRFVFPHAPMMPVTINGGFVMRAWYDIATDNLGIKEDEHGLRASQTAIEQMIAREVQRGIPTSRIVLAGFSQGGAMALQTGLRHPKKLAGVLVLSGYLPLLPTIERERNSANSLTAIFQGHGTLDPVVPMSLAAASRAKLTQLGYAIEWHDYPMMHGVCDEELVDVGKWLGKVLL